MLELVDCDRVSLELVFPDVRNPLGSLLKPSMGISFRSVSSTGFLEEEDVDVANFGLPTDRCFFFLKDFKRFSFQALNSNSASPNKSLPNPLVAVSLPFLSPSSPFASIPEKTNGIPLVLISPGSILSLFATSKYKSSSSKRLRWDKAGGVRTVGRKSEIKAFAEVEDR